MPVDWIDVEMDRWVVRVAVVTGAQIAVDFANAGVKVVGLTRRVERIEQLKSKVKPEFQKNLCAQIATFATRTA